MLNIIVTDAVWVSDRPEVYKFYHAVSVFDAVSVTDSATVANYAASVATSISILDSPTVAVINEFMQEEASVLPVWSLTASFAQAFTGDSLTLPAYSGLGYFGASLKEERIPLRTISANIADLSILLSGGANLLPTYSGSGRFGMRLSETIPVRTLTASFSFAGIFNLDSFIPVRTLEAAFKYPDSFTLSRQIPIWIGQGSLELSTYVLTLDARIPGALVLSGSLRDSTGYTVSAYSPVWKLDASFYQSNFTSDDMPIPAWMAGTRVSVAYENNRFTDYILRYVRE